MGTGASGGWRVCSEVWDILLVDEKVSGGGLHRVGPVIPGVGILQPRYRSAGEDVHSNDIYIYIQREREG